MKCLVAASLIVYVTSALVGCGQKGPLVLPDAPKRKHTIPTLPTRAKPSDTSTGSPAPNTSSPAAGPATNPATPASPPAPPTPPPQP